MKRLIKWSLLLGLLSGAGGCGDDAKREALRSSLRDAALNDEQARKGAEFLARNRERAAVQVTESGLQYEVVVLGHGPRPTHSDRVQVHYRGALIDGTEFDSSYQRGKPARFPVRAVIPGWQEALTMMPVGSHWRLYIPSALAYGARSPAAAIPPNATLIFDVELIEIENR